MRVFEWNNQLSTGIDKIDDQHKKLVGLVNDLADAMRAGKSRDVIAKVLDELGEYTKSHFGFEEAAFSKYGYPRAEEHAKSHGELIRELAELSRKHEAGAIGISVEVLGFVTEWVRGHIMSEDQAYVPFLMGKDL